MKFAFIQTEKAAFPVSALCRVLGVSRAGFYAAQRRPIATRVTDDVRLAVEIAALRAREHGGAALRAREHARRFARASGRRPD